MLCNWKIAFCDAFGSFFSGCSFVFEFSVELGGKVASFFPVGRGVLHGKFFLVEFQDGGAACRPTHFPV